jgi:hypothetical protein
MWEWITHATPFSAMDKAILPIDDMRGFGKQAGVIDV